MSKNVRQKKTFLDTVKHLLFTLHIFATRLVETQFVIGGSTSITFDVVSIEQSKWVSILIHSHDKDHCHTNDISQKYRQTNDISTSPFFQRPIKVIVFAISGNFPVNLQAGDSI